jgi:hypothetical protein
MSTPTPTMGTTPRDYVSNGAVLVGCRLVSAWSPRREPP